MSRRTREHIIGDRGEARTQLAFIDSGFACNEVEKDYGEDFFVVTHGSDGTVEPFRIFVQSKATEPSADAKARWTEYIDPLTARNWILGNEMVVVIKQDLTSRIARYCIPEEIYAYEDVHDYLFEAESARNFPIVCDQKFTRKTPSALVWRARVRHYDRLIRLALPTDEFRGMPAADVYAMELAFRLGLIDTPFQPSVASLDLLRRLSPIDGIEPEADMPEEDQQRYVACVRVTNDRMAQLAPTCPIATRTLDLVAVALTRAYRSWQIEGR